MIKHVSYLSVIAILSGCSGGTIGGLLPAPKILNGDLDGLVYTSPDKVFTVEAPASKDRAEWTYTTVQEHKESHPDQNSRAVSFKTPYDSHLYTVEVVNFPAVLDEAGAKLIAKDNINRLMAQTEGRWKAKIEQIPENSLDCGSNTYTYTAFSQHITSHSPNFYKYYLISQTSINNSFAIITSELNYDPNVSNIPDEKIKNMDLEKHNNFVCSVTINQV